MSDITNLYSTVEFKLKPLQFEFQGNENLYNYRAFKLRRFQNLKVQVNRIQN